MAGGTRDEPERGLETGHYLAYESGIACRRNTRKGIRTCVGFDGRSCDWTCSLNAGDDTGVARDDL